MTFYFNVLYIIVLLFACFAAVSHMAMNN